MVSSNTNMKIEKEKQKKTKRESVTFLKIKKHPINKNYFISLRYISFFFRIISFHMTKLRQPQS